MDITITDTIRAIWTNRPRIDGRKSDWITLRHLRDTIDAYPDTDWTREQIDQALTELMDSQQIHLIPESNQKMLTPADRKAAIWLGGEYLHLLAFDQ